MMLAWMSFMLLLTAVLGATALGLEQLSRRSGEPLRWAWAGAVVASLAIPLALLIVPRETASQAIVVNVVPNALSGANEFARLTQAAGSASAVTTASLDTILISGCLALSALMMATLVFSWLRLRRAAARWASTSVAGTHVLVSDNLGPAVVGFFRARIVVPRWILQADASTQKMAVLHESQHLAARDPQLLLGALICIALMPWNLPMWWLLRRLRTAMEIDCDARVLRSGENVTVYGRALLEVASSHARTPLLAPTLIEPTTQLERRIRLLDAPTGQVSKPLALSAALGLIGIAGVAMAQVTVPGPLIVSSPIPGDGTPLMIAVRNGDMRGVERLLAQGVDVNQASRGDGNALIIAAASGNERMVMMLVAAGADVSAFVEDDETPLINAARNGHLNVVTYLVGQGADVNFSVVANKSTSPERRSALSQAEKHGHRDVANYLRAHGAKS